MIAHINGLTADGNTSTDIGVKWAAALLDPGTQPVLDSMIVSGDVEAEMTGRPFDYNTTDVMKVMVVMTDGNHTEQYYMGAYRSGPSFVWKYVDGNGVPHYSIWWEGDESTPNTNPTGNHSYCDDWDQGDCEDWVTGPNPKFWFHAWSPDLISNDYEWRSTPIGGASAVRMTWDQVWAEIPPEHFSDEVLWEMEAFTFNERNAFEWAIDDVDDDDKDLRFDAICSAVKANNVIVFSIGLEITDSHATRLRNCATSPSHYFNVQVLNIELAFAAIASEISQLRLVQ